MKSLEICKSNLYKTKGLNNILLLDSPLGLDIIADSGLMNKSNVALLRQAGYNWKCTPCFTLQKEGLRHMYAPASSSAKYTRNWRDLLALTRLR